MPALRGKMPHLHGLQPVRPLRHERGQMLGLLGQVRSPDSPRLKTQSQQLPSIRLNVVRLRLKTYVRTA